MIIVAGGAVELAQLGLGLTLIGVDGSRWDLVAGPVKAGAGVALGPPDPEHWWRDASALDGSARMGGRVPRGDNILPVHLKASGSVEWRDLHAAFTRAVDVSGQTECFLEATAPDGVVRTQAMRYAGGLGAAYQIDPMVLLHGSWTLDFATPYPYWLGSLIAENYQGAELIVNTVGTKIVANPGDVSVWPKWTVTGSYTTATVGVAAPGEQSISSVSSIVTLGTAIGSGSQRIVDTDPRSVTVAVTDANGVDRWTEVTNRRFAQIPAGSSVSVYLGITDPGAGCAVDLEFTPAYRLPW